jgi:hypothetical protein
MSTKKYLCLYRGAPSNSKPSPAQMQEMLGAFNEWKEQFKSAILDMGSQLKPTGRVVTDSGVTDGPFAEAKEIVAGYMIVGADDYEGAVAVVKAMPMLSPGARVEIREMAAF